MDAIIPQRREYHPKQRIGEAPQVVLGSGYRPFYTHSQYMAKLEVCLSQAMGNFLAKLHHVSDLIPGLSCLSLSLLDFREGVPLP